jgi:GT2 family glycosyltransferase
LFVDADVLVQDSVVDRIDRIFNADPKIAAVFGSYDANPSAPGFVSRYRNLLHHFVHQQGNREAGTFWAGLGAVRRDAFFEVGGFDAARFPRPSIEDIELGYRLRKAAHRIRLEPGLQGTHIKGWTFRSMIRTDVTCRALPWARLILQSGNAADDLNLRASQRWSARLVAIALVLALLALVWPRFWGLSVAALGGWLTLNWRFYALLWRQGGLLLALGSVPLHFVYFTYSGLTYLYAWAEWRLRRAATALQRRGQASHIL